MAEHLDEKNEITDALNMMNSFKVYITAFSFLIYWIFMNRKNLLSPFMMLEWDDT